MSSRPTPRECAVKLYLRARDYGLRGLETSHPTFAMDLRRDSRLALAQTDANDVPFLYWTAAASGQRLAFEDLPALVAELPLMEVSRGAHSNSTSFTRPAPRTD
jgi:hypothetical protein